MKEISQEQVQAAVDSIKESQSNLNIGTLTTKTDVLDSVILILKECWNTTSGKEEQERLKQLTESNLDFSKVETALNSIKDAYISVAMVTQTTRYH